MTLRFDLCEVEKLLKDVRIRIHHPAIEITLWKSWKKFLRDTQYSWIRHHYNPAGYELLDLRGCIYTRYRKSMLALRLHNWFEYYDQWARKSVEFSGYFGVDGDWKSVRTNISWCKVWWIEQTLEIRNATSKRVYDAWYINRLDVPDVIWQLVVSFLLPPCYVRPWPQIHNF